MKVGIVWKPVGSVIPKTSEDVEADEVEYDSEMQAFSLYDHKRGETAVIPRENILVMTVMDDDT